MRKFAVLLFCAMSATGLCHPQARADFDAGVMAYANGDFDAAAREFSQLSEKGDMAGQYHMGLLYEEGQGVPKQFEDAVRCYTKAAEQGYVDAYFALGEIYLRQPGGKKDRVQAYHWLGMAKKHGHPRGGEEFERNRKAMTPEQIELAERAVRLAP
jgi:TPR repeat protein